MNISEAFSWTGLDLFHVLSFLQQQERTSEELQKMPSNATIASASYNPKFMTLPRLNACIVRDDRL